jgi:hypothetical protein
LSGTGGESWNFQYGDSTISHKAEVLPEAKAEGPQRKRITVSVSVCGLKIDPFFFYQPYITGEYRTFVAGTTGTRGMAEVLF